MQRLIQDNEIRSAIEFVSRLRDEAAALQAMADDRIADLVQIRDGPRLDRLAPAEVQAAAEKVLNVRQAVKRHLEDLKRTHRMLNDVCLECLKGFCPTHHEHMDE